MALDRLEFLLPKKKQKAGGQAATPGYNPDNATLTLPVYTQHRTSLFNSRLSDDSRTMLNELVRHDPDVSAAIFAFGTISGSAKMQVVAYDQDGEVSPEGVAIAKSLEQRLFATQDYSVGYSSKKSKKQFLDDLRYATLLRGAYGFELVYDKKLEPVELRTIDMAEIEWEEDKIGEYKPFQKVQGQNDPTSLDIPTFFTEKFHQNPNSIYSYSTFVSSINTIAARRQVIDSLYRIMNITGYPRVTLKVVEAALLENAPPGQRSDPEKKRQFVDSQLNALRAVFANIRPEQAFVHTDAVEAKILNEKNPGASLEINEVIATLDAQNQAALKTMPAVIGKGSSANTASTETRLFALSCDSLNETLASGISRAFTLAARIAGFQGHIEVSFTPIELRPTLELEPHLTMKSSRLKQDLSLGILSDTEYHLAMYGRLPAKGSVPLSGTNFLEQKTVDINSEGVSPNDDPLGNGLAAPDGQNAKSNRTKSGEVSNEPD